MESYAMIIGKWNIENSGNNIRLCVFDINTI